MSPQSHAQQLLNALYSKVLRRARRLRAVWALEPLPPRRLMSVTPIGGETLVNAGSTASGQLTPDVAVSSGGVVAYGWSTSSGVHTGVADAIRSDGQYLLVWASSTDIHAQFYNSSGATVGSEFIVNNDTPAGTQQAPDVAMDAAGDFVVVWDGEGTGDTDGVWARRFAPDGTPLAGQFRVNSSITDKQHDAAVAMAGDGSFLVAYTDDNSGGSLAAQYYDSTGTGHGALTVESNGAPTSAAVAANATGNFVVAFAGKISGNETAQYRRYTGGSAIDPVSVTVDLAVKDQADPAVAMDASGNFIVAWDESGRDGDKNGVFARHILANGSFDGASFGVNMTTIGDQQNPAVSMSPGGLTVIAWDGNGPGDNQGIFSQQDSTVLAANQPPVNTVPAAQTIAEDTSLVFSTGGANAITTADPDAGTTTLQVTLSVTSGKLTLASLSGLTFTSGDGVSDASMTFTGSATAINAALNGLNFSPAANANGTVTLSVTTNDLGDSGSGGALSDSDNVTINVTAVNDAPVNSIPPASSVSGGGLLNLGGGSGVPISVFDVDAGSSALEVTLSVSTGSLTLASTSGLTFTSGDGNSDSSMKFQGTQSAINAALDGMSYNAPLILLSNPAITITTDDLGHTGAGGALSDTDLLTLNSAQTNSAPVLALPSAQTMEEDANLVFSTAGGNAVSIDDTDAGTGELKVTLSSTHGVLTLSNTTGLTFSSGDGSRDALMTFTGTLADINNALQGLIFTAAADYDGAAAIAVSVDDQGNTGSGGAKTDSGSIALTINSVNDAPIVNLAAATQSINEDTPRVFSLANGNLISISDVDAGSGQIQVKLTATNGTLTLSGTSGLTFSSGDGTADGAMIFTGTLSAVNTALAGMSFTPAADFAGGATVAIVANDQGNSGSGGALEAVEQVDIAVAGVNDAPVNSVPGTQSAVEDTPLTFSSANGNAITIGDVDAGSLTSLQVTLSASNGTFALESTNGLTFTTGTGTGGETTMTFSGTADDINAALDGLIFTPDANFNGAASVTIATNDLGNAGSGGAKSDSDSVTINVAAGNDPPVLTLPGTQTINEDANLHFASGNGNPISVSDLDAGSGMLELTLTVTNGTVNLNALGGLTFISGSGNNDTAMTFRGTVANINAALSNMMFKPAANFNGSASIAFTLSDLGNTGTGGTLTDSGSVSITVNPVNDAPVNTVPSTRTINEDAPLVFSTANGNAISIGDVDAGNTGIMQVALASTNGKLTLSTTTGLSFSIGDGSDDTSMVFTGTIADINAALNGMTFVPTADFNGSGSVAIVTSDQGNTDSGGSQGDTDSVAITINAVNDPPVNTIPAAQTTNEDTPLVFSTGNGNSISVADKDASTLRVWLHVTDGTLTLAQTTGLTFTVGSGTNDADVIFQGTKSAINAALDGLTFNPTANASGAVTLQIVTSDLGATGSGGTKTDTDTVAIAVNSVNDPPTISIPSPQSVKAGLWLTLGSAHGNAITIADEDAGSGNRLKVTLTATLGTISLTTQAGLTFLVGIGAADTTVSFTGTLDDINFALNGMTFVPLNSTPGIGGIQISVDDQGNSGGPAQTATANLMVEMVNEFRANTDTTDTQQLQSVAMDSGGNYVVVWSGNQLSSNYGIWAQRYDAFGNRIGTELHLDSITANTQTTPVVAMDASGTFVAAWASNANTAEGWEIQARRFSFATGNPLGNEISVNVATTGDQIQPAIAIAPDGKFLIAWRGDVSGNKSDIYARMFNANGIATGGEFIVNSTTNVAQDQPAIAVDDSGKFVIVWRTRDTSGNAQGIFGQRFNSSGNSIGSEFQVNATANNLLNEPTVAMAWNGSFVVSWAAGNSEDGSSRGIFARQFNPAGNPIGAEFGVNTTTVGSQDVPNVGMDATGDFTIAWESAGQDGYSLGVYAQKYDSSGNAVGGEFRASGTTYGDQSHAAVAMSAASDLVVTWQGNGLGDDSGVFGQFWRSNNHVPINSIPMATQTTSEESPLILSSANGNGISIASFSPQLRVSLVATHGLLTLATVAGLTFSAGDGSIDTAMTFTGTLADINAALASLRYDPDLNYNGPAEIRVTTTDSTSGTPVTDEDTVAIDVTPVNDTPTTLGLNDVNVQEDAADTRVDLLSRFADIEDLATDLAYTISANSNAALLDSISVDPQTHELVLNYAANANGSATLTLRATDAGGLFVEATFTVNVAAVNDSPTLVASTGADLDAGESLVVTRAMLQVDDIDNTTDQLVYTITELPTQGMLKRGNTVLALGDSFTQTDLDAGRVTYSEYGVQTSDAFGFAVSDSSGGTISSTQFALAITQPPPPPPPTIPPAPVDNTPQPPIVIPPPVITPPPPSATEVTTTTEETGGKTGVGDSTSGSQTIPSVTNSSGGSSSSGNATAAAPAQAPTETVNNTPGPARAPEANAEIVKPPTAAREPINVAPAVAAPAPAPAPIAPAPVAPALPPPPPAAPVAFMASAVANPDSVLNQKLDQVSEQVTKDPALKELVAGSAQWASLAASVFYILWTIRAGYLLASLLSSMPAWTFVDPLPILDHFNDPNDPDRKRRGKNSNNDEDDESLQNLVERQTKANASDSGAQGELS